VRENFDWQCRYRPPLPLIEVASGQYNVPGIDAPDGHRFNHLDAAYVIFDDLDVSAGDMIVESMRQSLQDRTYQNHEGYVTWLSFASWAFFPRFTSPSQIWELARITGRTITGRNVTMERAKKS